MTQRFFPIVLTILMSAFTLSAKAQNVRDITFDTAGEDVAIAIHAQSPFAPPMIRSVPGRVMLITTGLIPSATFVKNGDGTLVKQVRLVAGENQYLAAHILVKDGLTIPTSRVRIETRDDGMIVRIAKNELAAPANSPANAPAAAGTAALTAANTTIAARPTAIAPAAPAASVATVATTTAPRAAAPAAIAPTVVAPTVETQAVAPAAETATTATTTTTAANAMGANTAFSGAIPASSGPSIPVILFLTLLLAGGYFGLRALLQKRNGTVAPAIDIVASKAIGARHKLIIVRAFGRDHLLSVHGNTTTRIATMKSPVAATRIAQTQTEQATSEDIARTKRLETLRDDDGALGLADLKLGGNISARIDSLLPPKHTDDVQPVRNGYGAARSARANDSLPPPANSETRKLLLSEETRFGAELMKLVRESVAPPAQRASVRPIDDATSGIVRLRKQTAR